MQTPPGGVQIARRGLQHTSPAPQVPFPQRVVVTAQGPELTTDTPARLASQLLLWVLPSQPQTGITTAGQNWGFASHFPV